MTPDDLEYRSGTIEVRASGRTIYGVAAPFGRSADIAGQFQESYVPGCFTATLAERDDIPAICDHRSDLLLGRTKSRTLTLTETAAGLAYELSLPSTPLGEELAVLGQRGDLAGCSIAFKATAEHWPNVTTRELRAVTLYEVSVLRVGPAAYSGTSIALRHRQPPLILSPAARRRLLDMM